MDESTRAAYRAQIELRLAEIAEGDALGAKGRKVVTLDQQSVGRLSRMDALQSQAMANAMSQRRATESARLRAALARLDEDEYGYGEDCGDPILPARLDLDLAATRCVSCASG